MQVTLLTVHSQDHLMTSIAFTDLAKKSSNFIVAYTANKYNFFWTEEENFERILFCYKENSLYKTYRRK